MSKELLLIMQLCINASCTHGSGSECEAQIKDDQLCIKPNASKTMDGERVNHEEHCFKLNNGEGHD